MDDAPKPAPLALDDRRQRTVDILVQGYASDRLTVDEFERRVDTAHRTTDLAELERLTADLPAIAAPAPAQLPEADRLIMRGAEAMRNAIKDSQTFVAVMGGVERRGRWQPARKNYFIAMMGGGEFDFREAIFPPGVTELYVVAMMGGLEIIVPPNLVVDASGIAIMGGFGHSEGGYVADPDQPVLKIRGLCLMGGVDISVRRAGESGRDAKRRLKEERRRLRDGGV